MTTRVCVWSCFFVETKYYNTNTHTNTGEGHGSSWYPDRVAQWSDQAATAGFYLSAMISSM